MLVDFFSNDTMNRDKLKYNFRGSDGKMHSVSLSEFSDPFEAKLSYSRFKDIWDYNRFIPNRIVTNISPLHKTDISDFENTSKIISKFCKG